jgi:hypothetical protein
MATNAQRWIRSEKAVELRPEDPEAYLLRGEYRRALAERASERGQGLLNAASQHLKALRELEQDSWDRLQSVLRDVSADVAERMTKEWEKRAAERAAEFGRDVDEAKTKASAHFAAVDVHLKAITPDLDRIFALRPDYRESSMDDHAKRTRALARWVKQPSH